MLDLDNKIYIKVDNHWFDLTNYKDHPGGYDILKKYHLKDATIDFNNVRGHCDSYVEQKLGELEIKDNLLIVYLNLICIKNKN
jgi:cytochrome b involved in lipid metabolism